MSNYVIEAKDITKSFLSYSSFIHHLACALMPKFFKPLRVARILQNISFCISPGESVAIIGRNGAGKSTLLHILARTLSPSGGKLVSHFKVSAMLELGSGFHPEYSGRDNVLMNGLLLGLSKDEVLKRFEEIEQFADIGSAIDLPVATYSSGMTARLAFAVNVICDPKILIIDEVLSVGDFFFQQKCFEYIHKLSNSGVTLIFVSHDLGAVRDLTKRALYIKDGILEFDGATHIAISKYMGDSSGANLPQPLSGAHKKLDILDVIKFDIKQFRADSIWRCTDEVLASKNCCLLAISSFNDAGDQCSSYEIGDFATIKIAYRASPLNASHVTVALKNRLNQVISSTNSFRMGVDSIIVNDAEIIIYELKIKLDIEAGQYSLIVKLGSEFDTNFMKIDDSVERVGPISVTWNYHEKEAPFLGMFPISANGQFFKITSEQVLPL